MYWIPIRTLVKTVRIIMLLVVATSQVIWPFVIHHLWHGNQNQQTGLALNLLAWFRLRPFQFVCVSISGCHIPGTCESKSQSLMWKPALRQRGEINDNFGGRTGRSHWCPFAPSTSHGWNEGTSGKLLLEILKYKPDIVPLEATGLGNPLTSPTIGIPFSCNTWYLLGAPMFYPIFYPLRKIDREPDDQTHLVSWFRSTDPKHTKLCIKDMDTDRIQYCTSGKPT